MIPINELRHGVNILDPDGQIKTVNYFYQTDAGWYVKFIGEVPGVPLEQCKPIQITAEVLVKCGFAGLPHYTISDFMKLFLGRDRWLTVASVGTPNEMVLISEEEPQKVKELVVLRNFDYDGKTYLHDLQNLVADITKGKVIITYTPNTQTLPSEP